MPSLSARAADAFARLTHAASTAGRPGVVVLDEDLPALHVGRRAGHDLVAGLERAGRLQRVRRGAYAVVGSDGRVAVDVSDLVAALSPDPYLVSGPWALRFHDLTDRDVRRLHVLAPTQARPWAWGEDEVRYVRTDKPLRPAVRSRRTRARVATPARAIADSLARPSWGVTLFEVVGALDAMVRRDPGFTERLAHEIEPLGNHALARRLGFLVSRIVDADAARVFLALRGSSKASTLMLASGPPAGPIDPTWAVQVNVGLGRLLRSRAAR